MDLTLSEALNLKNKISKSLVTATNNLDLDSIEELTNERIRLTQYIRKLELGN